MSIAKERFELLHPTEGRRPRPKILPACVVLLLLAMVCAGFIVLQTVRYSVQVPFWDEWVFLNDYQRYETGKIPLSELILAREGGHLHGAGRLVLWRLTGMNFRVLMVYNWFLAVAQLATAAVHPNETGGFADNLTRHDNQLTLNGWTYLKARHKAADRPNRMGRRHHDMVYRFRYCDTFHCVRCRIGPVLSASGRQVAEYPDGTRLTRPEPRTM
jgi:hypothetical protein